MDQQNFSGTAVDTREAVYEPRGERLIYEPRGQKSFFVRKMTAGMLHSGAHAQRSDTG